MRTQLFTFILLLFICKSFSQKLEITDITKNEGFLKVNLKLTNDKMEKTAFFKPRLTDFCNGIISLTLKTENKTMEYNICNIISQIDSIALRCSNVFFLEFEESLEFNYEIEFFEYLKNGDKIKCQINYQDVNFVDNEKDISQMLFKGVLTTDFVNINFVN